MVSIFHSLFEDFFPSSIFTSSSQPEKPNLPFPNNPSLSNLSKLYKLPFYIEQLMLISLSSLLNAFIYNLIILPIKTILMTLMFWKLSSLDIMKYKVNILKLLLFLIGLYSKSFLESSYPLFYIHHKLKSLRGIKIFALLKIIEFITTLFNRIHKDYELQLITILTEKKTKRKIATFITLIITLCLHIITFWAYMTSISISLTDPSNAIYALFFKINYIELKKCGKPVKKKNIMGTLTSDIYDRFINYCVFILVILKNYYENQISHYNVNEYISKVVFVFIFEIAFDWVKDFVIFRVSYFNPKIVKLITYEIAVYYEKLRMNSNIKGRNKYKKFIQGRENIIVGKQYRFENYIDVLGEESVMCLTLHTNVLVFNIMVVSVVAEKIKISKCSCLLLICILILIRKIIQLLISEFILKLYKKNNGKIKDAFKAEAEMYVNDPLKDEENEKNDNNVNINNNSSLSYNNNWSSSKKERKISLDEMNIFKRQNEMRVENGNPLFSNFD